MPVESVPVHTFWDLGRSDSTAIFFMQAVGKERRFIDYYEHRLVDLDHYAKVLQDKGYLYGTHYLPHDVEVKTLGSNNRSRREILEGMGVNPITTVPRISSAEGLDALANYQYQFDDSYQTFRKVPLHNWASNGSDAFRMFAQGYEDDIVSPNLEFASEW